MLSRLVEEGEEDDETVRLGREHLLCDAHARTRREVVDDVLVRAALRAKAAAVGPVADEQADDFRGVAHRHDRRRRVGLHLDGCSRLSKDERLLVVGILLVSIRATLALTGPLVSISFAAALARSPSTHTFLCTSNSPWSGCQAHGSTT